MDLSQGARFSPSDFEILEEIGEGSYGKVFRGLMKQTGQIVAIKVITLDTNWMDLIKEINIVISLHNEAVVNYYGWFFDTQGRLWIIMEFCNGGSLSDVMDVLGRGLTEMELSAVCHGLLKSVAYVHSMNVAHRDIKAANLLITTEGQVKLCDFGVSIQLQSAADHTGTMIGSPFWMAPEVITGDKGHNTKADIWSLGITALELYQRVPPRHDLGRGVITLIPKDPPPEAPAEASYLFRSFVEAALVKDPELRPTAEELLNHAFIHKCGDHGPKIVADLAHAYIDALAKKKLQAKAVPAEFANPQKASDAFTQKLIGVEGDDEEEEEEEEEEEDGIEDGTFVKLSPEEQATFLMGGGTFVASGTMVKVDGEQHSGLTGWNVNCVLGAPPAAMRSAPPKRRFMNFGVNDLKYMVVSLRQLAEKELAEGKNRQTVLSYYNEVRTAIIDELRKKGQEVADDFEALT